MIISTIATALVQCRARTQAGWITFVVVAVARSSLTVRVDMALPVGSSYQFIRREPGSRYCHVAIQSIHCEHCGQKKASRVAPARRLARPCWDARELGGRHQHGIDHMNHAVR